MICCARPIAGIRRKLWHTMCATPARSTAASMRSASLTVLARGFSQITAFPARAAAMAISAWLSPGVQMSTI